MTSRSTGTLGRRSVLQGMGVGALGLAGAALLRCAGAAPSSEGGAGGVSIEGATKGGGLPFAAPKVAGTPKRGGNYTSAVTTTTKQHDAHTALATNIYHTIGDKDSSPAQSPTRSSRTCSPRGKSPIRAEPP